MIIIHLPSPVPHSYLISCETELLITTMHLIFSFLTAPPTTNIPNATIEVMEDGSADIMCTSTGILTPTIEWELDSSPMPFTPVDVAPVDPVITQVSPLMFDVGSLTSVLPIANAVFPDHQGTYRCTGTNSHAGTDASDDATVLVTVLGRFCHTV